MFQKSLSKLTFHNRSRFKRFIPRWRKEKPVENTTKDATENATEKASGETIEESAVVIASQHHKHNVSQSRLYILPTELLREVMDYLPLSDAMALGVTCTRFYEAVASPILENDPSKENGFNVLAQLEISLGPWHSKPLCGGCLTSHNDDFFWDNQLELGPVQRRCKSTQKLVWLHPGLVTSFRELKQLAIDIRGFRAPLRSTNPEACSIQYANFDKKGTVLLDHSIDLLRFRYGNRPLLKSVFKFLEKFNIPICPHMTTGDPMIADIYRKDVLQYAPDSVDGWHHTCPVRNCKTIVHFRVEHYREGPLSGEKLTLNMSRSINVRNGAERQGWLSQAIITPDEDRFRESWKTSWSWKLLNDEIDKRNFIVNYPARIPYSSLLIIRREIIRLIDLRDGLNPPENIRSLYQPLIPHPNTAAFIGMKNDDAIRMRDNFDDLI